MELLDFKILIIFLLAVVIYFLYKDPYISFIYNQKQYNPRNFLLLKIIFLIENIYHFLLNNDVK